VFIRALEGLSASVEWESPIDRGSVWAGLFDLRENLLGRASTTCARWLTSRKPLRSTKWRAWRRRRSAPRSCAEDSVAGQETVAAGGAKPPPSRARRLVICALGVFLGACSGSASTAARRRRRHHGDRLAAYLTPLVLVPLGALIVTRSALVDVGPFRIGLPRRCSA